MESLLIIDPEAGHNNSVKLNPATENACIKVGAYPAAFDADGVCLFLFRVNGEDIPL